MNNLILCKLQNYKNHKYKSNGGRFYYHKLYISFQFCDFHIFHNYLMKIFLISFSSSLKFSLMNGSDFHYISLFLSFE